jgi:hypothetical protein
MAGDFYNANNVVVGHAMLMLKPWESADPIIDPADFDDVPLFTPADTAWADFKSAGATNEGFKVAVETSTTQVTIEEQSTPVGETVESKAIGIEAALAESTLESMRYSWGGSDITVTAAGVGQVGKRSMTLSDDIEYYVAVLESRNFTGRARRLFISKTSITGSGDTGFRRAADKQTFPIRVASICKPSEIEIVDVTAAATA